MFIAVGITSRLLRSFGAKCTKRIVEPGTENEHCAPTEREPIGKVKSINISLRWSESTSQLTCLFKFVLLHFELEST
ncbi:hypothetical protein BH20ACI3_BH20ACI3_16060 [soil metagenome]